MLCMSATKLLGFFCPIILGTQTNWRFRNIVIITWYNSRYYLKLRTVVICTCSDFSSVVFVSTVALANKRCIYNTEKTLVIGPQESIFCVGTRHSLALALAALQLGRPSSQGEPAPCGLAARVRPKFVGTAHTGAGNCRSCFTRIAWRLKTLFISVLFQFCFSFVQLCDQF